MLEHYMEFVFVLIIWSQGWPPMFWEYTKPWTVQHVGEVGTLNYDFVQGMLLTLFMMFVDAVF
jgi:hypothetical protein